MRSGFIVDACLKMSLETSLKVLQKALAVMDTYFLPVLIESGLNEPLLKWANHSSAGAV